MSNRTKKDQDVSPNKTKKKIPLIKKDTALINNILHIQPEDITIETPNPVAQEIRNYILGPNVTEPQVEHKEENHSKLKRCPNGERRNRKTKLCEPNKKTKVKLEPEPEPEPEPESDINLESGSDIDLESESESESDIDLESESESESENTYNVTLTPEQQNLQNQLETAPTDNNDETHNRFLQHKEELEREFKNDLIDNDFLYPELNDPNFNIKIAKHKEFFDTKMETELFDIEKQADIMCKADFELLPHQMFVKNFLSLQTPYNSLLLYHGLGTGKTCSAIGISEEMRQFMKQIDMSQKIIIVASPNVQKNFRLQLFDERKLVKNGETWDLNTCVGNNLLSEINPTEIKNIPRERVISQINSIIKQYYSFVGYTELANFIKKKIDITSYNEYTPEKRKQILVRKIQKVFNNRLIIIDEVHNIRPTDDNQEKKKTANLLMKVCKHASNTRLVLLSATPLYNHYKEIVWLTNLMNINDNRSTIVASDVFDKNGELLDSGRELLQRKLTGYISFVRGENPYTFPYRIYPSEFSPENILDIEKYPKKQMNNQDIVTPIQHLPLYMNNVNEYQKNGYDMVIAFLRERTNTVTTKYGKIRELPSFENMESFGYSYLEKPLQALDIVYPSPDLDEYILNSSEGRKKVDVETLILNTVGKNGLSNIMTSTTTPLSRHNFDYKPEFLTKYGRIFSQKEIHKYSAKISSVCKSILQSTGIILVYSQYIDGGIVPMALALEEMGFSRYGASSQSRNLLKSNKNIDPIDALTMKTNEELSKHNPNTTFKQAKYVMISGNKKFSPDNLKDIKYITNPDNKDGNNVKVVLITKAAAEGLDFKNIRQVHILEPWYNMNRQEQIIGRGVRNLSHCNLPFQQRNVEIYLHSSNLGTEEESADLYVYRFAEKKAKLIGNITQVLKEIAVDCLLNIGQTNFTVDKIMELSQNKSFNMSFSSKKDELIEYSIGDKDFSSVCDYQECNTNFTCSPHQDLTETDVIKHTYTEDYAIINYSVIVKRIRSLFKEQNFYTRDTLIRSINILRTYPDEQIDFAITRFIDNKQETIVDKYGRSGYLINKDDLYIFQPLEITDTRASLYERTVPIHYKHESLSLNLPEPEKERDELLDTTVIDVPYNDIFNTIEANHREFQAKKDFVYVVKPTQIKQNQNKNKPKINKQDTWYGLFGYIYHFIKERFSIPDNILLQYCIFHNIDTLNIENKLTLIKELYSRSPNNTNNELENIIKQYFDKKTFYFNGSKSIIIGPTYENLFVIYCQDKSHTNIWKQLEDIDIQPIKDELKLYIDDAKMSNKVCNIIGFMWLDTKKKLIKFKTRELDSLNKKKINIKGSYCETIGRSDIILRLNQQILDIDTPSSPYKSIIEITEKEKDNIHFKLDTTQEVDKMPREIYCVITEILLRKFDDDKKDNKRWFYDSIECTIINMMGYKPNCKQKPLST